MSNKIDPLLFLAETMLHGSSEAIERQEADGQRRACGGGGRRVSIGRRIPARGFDGRAVLAAVGVVFLEPDKPPHKDSVLQQVELPEGWKLQPTDHSMWSNIIDDKGRERASCFYKAAFYDRDAFVNLNTRYYLDMVFGKRIDGEAPVAYCVMDRATKTALLQTELTFDREIEDHEIEQWASAGFLVYMYRNDKLVAGIDGGGYDFVTAHYLKVYWAKAKAGGWCIETDSGPRIVKGGL